MTDAFDRGLWRELADDRVPDGLIRRRVLPSLAHDVFIGELRPGRERVLIMEIAGEHTGLPPRRPSSKGLKVEVEDAEPDMVRIRLTSMARADWSLFAEVANDVAATLSADPGAGAAKRVLNRVVSWQNFFATKRDDFSLELAAGLFSELHVLSEVFLPTLGAGRAVAAWCGPDPAVQDFQLATLALEVKSFRGAGPGRLLISSELQLDLAGVDSLFIAYVRLDQRQDGSGPTLLDAINTVREALVESPPALDLFEHRLLSYGWVDSFAEYRTEKYDVRTSEAFRVTEGFPRITPASLPNGVGGVTYAVDRSAIEAFLVPWEDLAEMLKELA
ncbi:PD-(D/E)XK motif protein [Nocardioides carbamazepini]|uniref:PD-(D/E)XK motif protein n=1 Tax=Nocardioides carbamazepini TaxID=2854259 RepID=UPI00214A4695|nr:PD-(D/E)XK motif protein [Nocardioides carbamazepini]MCR1785414.1 PD-(D/E)XK motif protein [Nocardioides carbamazepini]